MLKTKDSTNPELPDILSKLLTARGIEGKLNQNKFLYPSLSDLPSPDLMFNLKEAALLAVEFITKKKKIIIWGDYDVDGTTGTALLVLFFRLLDVEVLWHIPNRLNEGYGLNTDWFLENIGTTGTDFLLITVDCGVSDNTVVDEIISMGGRVIVTDHHTLPENFNPSSIVVNPSNPQCGFNKFCLAGVGVAFYLAAAIRKTLSGSADYREIYDKINLKSFLPLVALGTISDIVDLTPVNRILVRAGLEAMNDSKFEGLNQLLESCEIPAGDITSEDVGFVIGPKINAAGRLGDSKIVVCLLTEEKAKKAKLLAKKLLEMNLKRRSITEESLETALTLTSMSMISEDKCIIVIGNIHKGVAGIVASRLVDMHKVPVVILANPEVPGDGELAVGSARSIDGINIIEIIRGCSEYLEKSGGHAMAAGLSLKHRNIDMFKSMFKTLVKQSICGSSIKKPSASHDIECHVDDIMNDQSLSCFKLLEPFGPKNPQPVFLAKQSTVIDSNRIGRSNEHLSVSVRTKYSKAKGIGFNLGGRVDEIQSEPRRNILFTPTKNRFRGTTNWQLRIIDI